MSTIDGFVLGAVCAAAGDGANAGIAIAATSPAHKRLAETARRIIAENTFSTSLYDGEVI
jgi:hypothetical protein